MDAAGLKLIFSEAVDHATFKIDQLSLQNTVTGATSIVVLGNESSTISGDGVTISVTLANDIMNQIKSSDDLATDLNGTDGTAVNRTFITITAQGVDDMNSNDIVAIVDPALQVSTYKEDAAAALITAFDLNMNTGTLTLEFTETMDVSSRRHGNYIAVCSKYLCR
jgi:hypothetical protein